MVCRGLLQQKRGQCRGCEDGVGNTAQRIRKSKLMSHKEQAEEQQVGKEMSGLWTKLVISSKVQAAVSDKTASGPHWSGGQQRHTETVRGARKPGQSLAGKPGMLRQLCKQEGQDQIPAAHTREITIQIRSHFYNPGERVRMAGERGREAGLRRSTERQP